MRFMTRITDLVCAGAAMVVLAAGPASADTTIRVDENGEAGWFFNPDPANATAGASSIESASIGAGSPKGGPIGSTAAEKFIVANSVGVLISDLSSTAYDF